LLAHGTEEKPTEAPKESAKEAPTEASKEAPKEAPKEGTNEASKEPPKEQLTEQPKEPPKEETKEEPKPEPKPQLKEVPKEQPATVAAPAPAPAPVAAPAPTAAPISPVKKAEPAKLESSKHATPPGGIHNIINKAKGQAENAGVWIQSHPLQAGLIGAGVAIGSLLVGWVVFRAVKGSKAKSGKSRRHHARSLDFSDAVMSEFPSNSLEKRAILDEIDWNDEEFLEFLNLLPEVQDILESNVE